MSSSSSDLSSVAAALRAACAALPAPPSYPQRIIITHGNCCDGQGASFLWSEVSSDDSLYFPVSPSDRRTWPDPAKLPNWEIVFVDVCFPRPDMEAYAAVAAKGGKSLKIFDHHPQASLISVGEALWDPCSVVSQDRCATYHVWAHLHPGTTPPLWVQFLDDIDNWRNITVEHKALREIMHPIAKLAVDCNPQVAHAEWASLVVELETDEGWAANFADGLEIHRAKMEQLHGLIDICPRLEVVSTASPWALPPEWLGTVFVINTGREHIGPIQFDTTAAAELIFESCPLANVFVNYHEVRWLYRGKQQRKLVYHARARDGSGVNLTLCPALKGHASAAGGQLEGLGPLPFELPR